MPTMAAGKSSDEEPSEALVFDVLDFEERLERCEVGDEEGSETERATYPMDLKPWTLGSSVSALPTRDKSGNALISFNVSSDLLFHTQRNTRQGESHLR